MRSRSSCESLFTSGGERVSSQNGGLSRRAQIGAGVAVLTILGLALIYALRSERPPVATSAAPTASPQASPTVTGAPTATAAGTVPPSPATSPTATTRSALDDRFGLIVTSGDAIWVRPETDPQRRSVLTGAMFRPSPDGTQIAFWRDGTDGPSSELLVAPAARSDQARSIHKVPSGQRGVEIVWASDGTGVLVTQAGVSARTQSLVTVDLRPPTRATTLASLTDGRTYVAIAWDRIAELVAAAESTVATGGPAAPFVETYLTIKPGLTPTVSRTRVNERIATPSIRGSPDGKYAFGDTADGVRAWPASDYSAGTTFQTTGRTGNLLWRPGTAQVMWLNTRDLQLEAHDVATKTATTLFRGLAASPSTGVDLLAVRVDGSAAVAGPLAGTAPRTLIDLKSGATTPVEMGSAFGIIGAVRMQ